ncbi:MAG: O-antigen ligase [Syntrophomonadaceae bacterium]|nr:O-antigen ligase [Bacillota bacterium]
MELLKNKGIAVEKLIFWTFCAMFFSMPIGTTPMVIFGLLTLLLWIFSGRFLKSKQQLLKNKKIFLPVLVFMAIPWIGLIYTENFSLGLEFARKSYYWLFAFAIASLSFSNYSPKTFFKAFLAGLTITSLFSVGQFIDLIPMREWLPTVFEGRRITMSLLLVLGMSISSFYFLKENRLKHRILILFLILLLLFTLSISQGRIGYLAFIALSPLIAYNLLGQKHIFKVAAISILIVSALFLSPVVRHRFDQTINDIRLYREGDPRTGIGLRLHMWEGAVKIFTKNPIIGVGTGGYQLAMEKFDVPALQEEFRDPHNSFLHTAANHGIVGLISLCWLFAIMLKAGWQHRHTATGFSVFSYGLVLLIGSLAATQILTPKTGMLFALFIGLCAKMPEEI